MTGIVCIHAASSGKEMPDNDARPHIHASCALGPQHSFMSGKAEHINSHFLHIHRIDARRLGRVRHKQNSLSAGNLSHPFQVDHISGQIRCMGTDNGFCIIFYCSFHFLI